jgi:hypothetical protein
VNNAIETIATLSPGEAFGWQAQAVSPETVYGFRILTVLRSFKSEIPANKALTSRYRGKPTAKRNWGEAIPLLQTFSVE